LKFNLLDNRWFISSAAFQQRRAVPVGAGNTQTSEANIRGVELETNYQPNRNVYLTASYSFIKTTLNTPAQFFDYPAALGENISGAGLFATFKPGQTFDDPGQPQHLFNVLGSYKLDNGLGIRLGVQATGPIQTSTSGQLDPAKSLFVPASVAANGYYYNSPVIPWQYTANLAVFYQVSRYTFTMSIYNLTDRLNWEASPPFYGNDFILRNNPRTFEFRLQAKF
jgi:hypothetical protein